MFQWTSTRIRLIAAGLVGIFVFGFSFMLETDLRILLAYDLAISTYLGILLVRIANADGETTRDLAESKEGQFQIIVHLTPGVATARIISAAPRSGLY